MNIKKCMPLLRFYKVGIIPNFFPKEKPNNIKVLPNCLLERYYLAVGIIYVLSIGCEVNMLAPGFGLGLTCHSRLRH
jgi:hypothetical protein